MSEMQKLWDIYLSNVKSFKDEYKRNLQILQLTCSHMETEVVCTMWAPGHFGADITVCKRCGKEMQK